MKAIKFNILVITLSASLSATGQGTNMVYEKIDVSPDPYKFLHSDIDNIPGTEDYVISATQKFPFYVVDKDLNIKSTYDVGNWYAGSRLSTSSDGQYTLLQQLFYLDFAPNKDREVKFEVIETYTGKEILTIDAGHDADFHPNNQELIVLEGDNLYSYSLTGKGKKVLLPTPEATNCMAFSPDGSKVAISHHVEDDYLNAYVTKKGQKDNYKLYKKYRQCVSVYETENYTRLYSVDEMFDIPYALQFSPDGSTLLCYSVPHTKVVAKTGMTGSKYISVIDSETGKTLPRGFVSNSIYEPDFEFSNSHKYFALVTVNRGRFPEIWVCNYDDASIIARFELAKRMFGSHTKGQFPADDGRVGIAFSPDDSHILITNGSLIFKWQIPYEN
jgi:WD40 repeat protein